MPYLVIGSLSGTSPGFAWTPTLQVPINYDFVTDFFVANPNTPLLANSGGTFDAQGNATAVLTLPPGLLTVLAGSTLHWTFGAFDAASQPLCVGEADPLLLLP